MVDKTVEITFDLDGLRSMESARRVLEELEDGVEDQRPYNIDDLKKLKKIRREIEKGGAGFEFNVEVELEVPDEQ